MSVIGNAVEPMAPPIAEELKMLVKRLVCLRENFNTLADDFGVYIDHPPMVDDEPSPPDASGLAALRTEITRINIQISLIEQLHERLYAAQAQLFGIGSGKWQTADTPIPNTPGNYAPVRTGDFRAP